MQNLKNSNSTHGKRETVHWEKRHDKSSYYTEDYVDAILTGQELRIQFLEFRNCVWNCGEISFTPLDPKMPHFLAEILCKRHLHKGTRMCRWFVLVNAGCVFFRRHPANHLDVSMCIVLSGSSFSCRARLTFLHMSQDLRLFKLLNSLLADTKVNG